MPFYQRLGEVPRKRHVQFRDDGTLLTEEVMGLEGFSGNESILYHLSSPCRVQELGDFEPIKRDEWVPKEHKPLHLKTWGVKPEGDAVIFVHEGSGTIESIFGDLPYKPGDYVVIPRGTTYRFVPEGEQRYLVFETPGLIEIPRRYRNQYGQLLEGAPYYHRDIHPPAQLNTRRDRSDYPVKVRVRGGY